jgi:hypothetical protein
MTSKLLRLTAGLLAAVWDIFAANGLWCKRFEGRSVHYSSQFFSVPRDAFT